METNSTAFENVDTCHYCGLTHPSVECRGLHSCPNVLCTGPGPYWWRTQRKSFRDVDSQHHTVDGEDMIAAAREFVREHINDKPLVRKIMASAADWMD